jgi:hypothetical protein
MEQSRDAIVWWERRRLAFNLIVLMAGACTIFVLRVCGSLLVRLGADVIEPSGLLPGILVYALGVNICYTLGWVTELLWSDGDTSRTGALRPTVYRWGLTFSVAVTLLPAFVVPLLWLMRGLRAPL